MSRDYILSDVCWVGHVCTPQIVAACVSVEGCSSDSGFGGGGGGGGGSGEDCMLTMKNRSEEGKFDDWCEVGYFCAKIGEEFETQEDVAVRGRVGNGTC